MNAGAERSAPVFLYESMMLRARFVLSVLAFGLSACNGCDDKPAGAQAASGTAPNAAIGSAAPATSTKLTLGRKTTNAEIALSNLDSAIGGAREVAKVRGPGSVIGLLLERAKLLGRPDDLEEALRYGESAAKEKPKDASALLAHARALAGAHRFREALSLIASAEAVSIDPGQADVQKASVLLALGRYDEAHALMKKTIEVWPNPGFMHLQAVILQRMNKIEDAEAMFVLAEQKYIDLSPFPLAMLHADRAAMWESQGDLGKATELYRAAHERLPQYVHAAVHYAALLTPVEAMKVLSPLATGDRTKLDPELLASLAGYRALTADEAGAALDLTAAKERFDALEKKLPLAYADHAGWFWLGSGGDSARAFEAAKRNLEERTTSESYELFLAAALSAGKRDEACARLKAIKAYAYPSPKLGEAVRQLGDCPATP
jgi:tetratricopeptide (TPR) repeat protein